MAVARKWRALAEEKSLSIRDLIVEVTGRQTFTGTPAAVAESINRSVQDGAGHPRPARRDVSRTVRPCRGSGAGTGADAEVWILGSSAGQSAQAAGALGLPFAANYHVSPATVLEAVAAYRAAFRPSAVLAAPHVRVSADVVVAPTDAEARELAAG